MAILKDKKINGENIGKNPEHITVEYDFDKDGGAIGVLEVFEADSKCVLSIEQIYVEEAITSGGAATLDIGKTNEFYNGEAIATFSNDAVLAPANKILMNPGDKINMETKVAALTAGKVKFVFKLLKA